MRPLALEDTSHLIDVHSLFSRDSRSHQFPVLQSGRVPTAHPTYARGVRIGSRLRVRCGAVKEKLAKCPYGSDMEVMRGVCGSDGLKGGNKILKRIEERTTRRLETGARRLFQNAHRPSPDFRKLGSVGCGAHIETPNSLCFISTGPTLSSRQCLFGCAPPL